MPRRHDIQNILIIGAGPIVIGQACEFDYSGSQGCKAIKEEGYRVILLNSNPATIMTDPDFADVTYIEPITPEVVENIIIKERVDAILPTVGGQTALNCVSSLYEMEILQKHRVKLIGANYEAIKNAEDREQFRNAMLRIGLDIPQSFIASTIQEGEEIASRLQFPLIIRPSYTLGGSGGSISHTKEEFHQLLKKGLEKSRIHQVSIEESLIGWKEFELEIMRDRADNVVIICAIENIDPMGVHTGDSVTVAPAQTLTDREYQTMRNQAKAIIREIGVDTGGANVQFAIHPETGRIVVIEINPRVSRSSALASKATGFPIAKIAAKLAVGYTLNELPNDITRKTPASFEPAIDYCVVKIPRFTFEKFPGSKEILGISMQSIGEAMSIGRTFKEALQKGIQSMEQDLELGELKLTISSKEELTQKLVQPNPDRLFYIYQAFQQGMPLTEVYQHTLIDPWFLDNILQLVEMEQSAISIKLKKLTPKMMRKLKEFGFSDQRLAGWYSTTEEDIRKFRLSLAVTPSYKSVDTCAAEFEAYTPYYYSTYDLNDEVEVTDCPKVVILGSGPNRIGQGIEFDYCCCQSSFALREIGIQSIMVNCNPETVSTDYDTSDRLYFEPLTYEHIMNIIEKEKPMGVILQFGGQTPLKLAKRLHEAGVKIYGTSYESIDIAEDRKKFSHFIQSMDLEQPRAGASYSPKEALEIAEKIGYPVLARPSYVLGGRSMKIIHSRMEMQKFMMEASKHNLQYPILIDQFLEGAVEIDVDAICDGTECQIAGIMEHIEKTGVHSGDSSCSLPPFSINSRLLEEVSVMTRLIARELKVVGLINIQYAIQGKAIYILEANLRASRTIPFVSKATGVSWAKLATTVCMGRSLSELNILEQPPPRFFSVKEVVFPFNRIHGSQIEIGVEMHSTGETMGIGKTFLEAYSKALISAKQMGDRNKKCAYIELQEKDRVSAIFTIKELIQMGYLIITDAETGHVLEMFNIENQTLHHDKQSKWDQLNPLLSNGKISFVSLTSPNQTVKDNLIRRSIDLQGIPLLTTLEELQMYVSTLSFLEKYQLKTYPLQSLKTFGNS